MGIYCQFSHLIFWFSHLLNEPFFTMKLIWKLHSAIIIIKVFFPYRPKKLFLRCLTFSSACCRYATWKASVNSVNAIFIRHYILWVCKCLTCQDVSTLLHGSQNYSTVQKGWNLDWHSWHHSNKQTILLFKYTSRTHWVNVLRVNFLKTKIILYYKRCRFYPTENTLCFY
jgi:hypothetical protein